MEKNRIQTKLSITQEQSLVLKDLQSHLNRYYQENLRYIRRTKQYKVFIVLLPFLLFFLIINPMVHFVFKDEILLGLVIYMLFILPILVTYLSFRHRRIKNQYILIFDQLFNQIKKFPKFYTLYQEELKITSVSNIGRSSITLALLSLDFKFNK